MKKLKDIDGKLDTCWSKLVKLRAGMKCEVPRCKHKPTLNSHHIFTRSRKSTRWDAQNGICLCVGHHTMSSTFSAHKTGYEFSKWLDEYKGKKFMDRLTLKANAVLKLHKFEKELLLKELQKEIESYDN
jgi:hypothetical protein